MFGIPYGIDRRIKTPNPPGARTGGANGEGNGSGREWEEHSSQRIVGAVNPQRNCPFKDEANPRDGHCIPERLKINKYYDIVNIILYNIF